MVPRISFLPGRSAWEVGGLLTYPPFTRISSVVSAYAPPAAVLALMVLFVVQFSVFAWVLYANYGYSGYDLGKNSQTIWLFSRLQTPFNTIRGMHAFGDHVAPMLALLAPLYWIWPSPEALLLLNILFRGVGAWILYRIASYQIGSRWVGVFFAAVLLLNPEYGNAALDHFYPESLAPAIIFFAYYMLLLERYSGFYAASALLMSVKEDAPVIVFMMALHQLIFTCGRHYLAGDKRKAQYVALRMLAVAAVSLLYFLFCIKLLSFFGGDDRGFSDSNYFGGFWENKFNLEFYTDKLSQPDVVDYLNGVFGPFAFLPLLSPHVSLICLPSLAFNVVTPWPYARNLNYHYSVYITPFLVLGVVSLFSTIRGLFMRWRRRTLLRWFVVLVCGLFSAAVFYSTVDYNRRLSRIPVDSYPHNVERQFTWYENNRERTVIDKAVSYIPEGAGVSADPFIVTRLSTRTHIYQYTNPWKAMYYGKHDTLLPDPGVVDYVLVKTATLHPEERDLLSNLTASGQFRVIYSDGENIQLLRRPG